MFTITLINTLNIEEFINSIMKSKETQYLKEIERQLDVFIDKNYHYLFLSDRIDDMLDIRDILIIRYTKLQRISIMKSYL